MTPPFQIGNLGEIALRCRDYPAMVAFYRDVLGLKVLRETVPGKLCFFRLAPGFQGHVQVLALFARDLDQDPDQDLDQDLGQDLGQHHHATYAAAGAASSLHHLALGISAADQPAAADWLRRHNHPCHFQDFEWIGWRGLFTTDPDGNTVELVARIAPPKETP